MSNANETTSEAQPSAANEATGRGKLIVFGEHAVVYGHRAVACSLPRGATAVVTPSSQPRRSVTHVDGSLEIDERAERALAAIFDTFELSPRHHSVDVELSIPVGCGLGSSAAMAVAVARSAARLTDLDEDDARGRIDEAVAASESVFHGKSSGIDHAAALGTGFFAFSNTHGWPEITSLDVPEHRWIVARVAPPAPTSQMVASVATLRQRHPQQVDPIFERFDALASAGAQALEAGRWSDVGALMDLNQGLLSAIGVSTPDLESACYAAREAGALGAKLTGAGGGGCIIALANDDSADDVMTALQELGQVYSYTLPPSNP